jgi:hypothetical protein
MTTTLIYLEKEGKIFPTETITPFLINQEKLTTHIRIDSIPPVNLNIILKVFKTSK